MLKYLKSLTIRKADGTDLPVDGDEVALEAGLLLRVDAESNQVRVSVDPSNTETDSSMLLKYRALLDGGSGEALGRPYTFSGAPYYYSSLSDIAPLRGCVWLLGSMCSVWGLFEDDEHAAEGPVDGSLALTDVCAPCVDCEEYQNLYRYLDALKAALDDKKDIIYAISDDYTEQNNILTLYRQTILYWNNMVQRTSWRCNIEADGQEIDAAVMFTNHFDVEIPAGFELTILLSSGPVMGAEASIIDVVCPVNYDSHMSGSPLQKWEDMAWTADLEQETVTFELPQGYTLLPTVDSWVSITGSSDITTLPGGVYTVVSQPSSTSFTLSVPAMCEGATEGVADAITLQCAILRLEEPLEVGHSVRLYVGSVSPTLYEDAPSAAIFGNNLEQWFPEFPSSKEVQSNSMVIFTHDLV